MESYDAKNLGLTKHKQKNPDIPFDTHPSSSVNQQLQSGLYILYPDCKLTTCLFILLQHKILTTYFLNSDKELQTVYRRVVLNIPGLIPT